MADDDLKYRSRQYVTHGKTTFLCDRDLADPGECLMIITYNGDYYPRTENRLVLPYADLRDFVLVREKISVKND